MRLKKALEKRMLKVTKTTGSCRTHGARTGAIMASLSLKFRMAMVFVALIRTEFTGPTGTIRVMRMMRMMRVMRVMIQIFAASLTLSMQMTRFKN